VSSRLNYSWSMIFSENRYPLFGIMLERFCDRSGLFRHCAELPSFRLGDVSSKKCASKRAGVSTTAARE
jgi:hypothetical protein